MAKIHTQYQQAGFRVIHHPDEAFIIPLVVCSQKDVYNTD